MDKFVQAEFSLLKALSVRENFNTYYDSINKKHLTDDTNLLLKDYKKYFDRYDHEVIDMNELYTHFAQSWHKELDSDDIDYYKNEVFPRIADIRDSQIANALLIIEEKNTTDKITQELQSGIDVEKIQELLTDYNTLYQDTILKNDDEAFTIDNVDFGVLDKANGIPWFLPSLQRGLGSLVQGQFVVVSADYGTGKSAFVINQAVKAFTRQPDKPILYFNSEGTQADVFCRFLSCLYHKHIKGGFEEVLERIDEVREKFAANFDVKNFMVFQTTVGSIGQLKQKVEQYKPSLVIIDIADVLAAEEDVRGLKKLYDTLRLLSGAYCPIIGTTQSGDTSYKDPQTGEIKTRKFLGDKALYGSKAG